MEDHVISTVVLSVSNYSYTMKILLVIAIIAFSEALASYQGVEDTPEVAHAKAEHFAAVAKAKAQIYSAGAGHLYGGVQSNSWHVPHYAPTVMYHGPIALPPGYDKNGAPLPVQDTPEVAHAKAVQLSLIAKAGGDIYPSVHHSGIESGSYEGSSWSAPQIHHQYASNHLRYHGPIAYSPGYDKYGAPLPVLETPEVSHTKAEHFHNYAKTLSNLIAKGLYEPDYTAQKEHEHHNSW
ncbi:hypothetical protein O3M35_012191 [Rhynocoris fuscipes]|uniref:Uncharacterized protein n=1 Tax=Rhynocoris fuscipes TaxID=488301 RepID=A0AAW1CST3_9HEMI